MLTLKKVLGNCVHVFFTKNYVRSYFSYLNSSDQILNVLSCLELFLINTNIQFQGHYIWREAGGGRKRTTQTSTLADSAFIIFYTLITMKTMKHSLCCLMVFSSLHMHYSIELFTRMEIFSSCITMHNMIATSHMWVLRTWNVIKELIFYFILTKLNLKSWMWLVATVLE